MSFDEINKKSELDNELKNLSAITFKELEDGVQKWLLVPDTGIIKLLCALVISMQFDKKPVWTMIIAPSGGGKTEFLNGLLLLDTIFELSTITPQTFLSGMPGRNDASLLPKVDGKIVVMKDFTSIISMNRDARSEIMGQLREIHDGRYKKVFGNGQTRDWKGKMGLICASTQAIDIFQQENTHLGERFINYRIVMPDRKEVAYKSLQNDDHYIEMQKDIQQLFYAFFKDIDMENIDQAVKLPDDVIQILIDLSDFCTRARSGVIRDRDSKKTVIFVPAAEMPGRMINNLSSIASGLAAVNKDGKLTEVDMKIVYKCALDSIPATNRMVALELAKADERTTADIATSLGYPTAAIRIYLENLSLLKVSTRIKASDSEEGGTGDRWSIKKEFKELLQRYENIGELTDEEKAQVAHNAEVDAEWGENEGED